MEHWYASAESTVPPGGYTRLFAIMSYGGQDGPQGLDAHGDVQQVGGEEEVVVVTQNGHDGVPDQI